MTNYEEEELIKITVCIDSRVYPTKRYYADFGISKSMYKYAKSIKMILGEELNRTIQKLFDKRKKEEG